MRGNRMVIAVAALIIVVCAGIASYLMADRLSGRGGPPSIAAALVGGPFTLTDQTGARRSDTDFHGRLMLVYFGYTWCPDVCPTELQVMGTALDILGEDGAEVVPILITIDPERDTPEVLADYVPLFHERLVGLSGTEAEIAAAAKAYRVYYARAGDEAAGADYLMDHSSLVFLMGRDGAYLRHFSSGTTPEDMAAAIRAAL